jgi:GNAT superfamily N-acetyltransferase
MSTRIELIDTRTAPEETLRALHQLYLARDTELEPEGDPPVPWEQRLIDWRHLLETEAIPRWALWQGNEIVATAGAYMDLEQNLDNAFGWVYVHPDHRGSSHGRNVVSPMLDEVEAASRSRFAVQINQGRPEEKIAVTAGMKPAYTERKSRLAITDVDWSLMDLWVKRAEERAVDYEVLFLPSPVSDELLEAYCSLWQVMNTAPREEYEEDDQILTPAMLRDIERKDEAKAKEVLVYAARHKPSGALVGFTEVTCHRLQPDLVWQGDTGVDPAHRNMGIGRWLKASMAMKLREHYPEARRIDTYNAGSNAPMLSINVEMGFKPIMIQTVWQGDLLTLRRRLSV